jgi:probable HAF family extracellular repeat protein
MGNLSLSARWSRLAAICALTLSAPHYSWASAVIANLGDLGGGKSFATFINNAGDVAGYSYTNTTDYHAIFYYAGITNSTYTNGVVYDLGTFGGNDSQPRGLNDADQISGTSYSLVAGKNVPQAFLYSAGVTTNLGTLGGSNSFGDGINSAGTVVGGSYIDNSGNQHAFATSCTVVGSNCVYPSTPSLDLGTGGGSVAEALFINDSGNIAGNTNRLANGTAAFYSSDGNSMNLISLGGTSAQAKAMNASGQVVGVSGTASGPFNHAFLYTPGTSAVLTDIGTLNNYNGASIATAINSSGEVVGQSDVSFGVSHAFSCVVVGGICQKTDLGTLNNGVGNSSAAAINDIGEIVGTASVTGGGMDPFVWINGQMIDLNSVLPANSGFSKLLTATGINNQGVIIGQGLTTNCTLTTCATDAYVLTFTGFQVPEPSTVTLMTVACLGGAFFVLRRRRQILAPPKVVNN